jgi:hypothetical protein
MPISMPDGRRALKKPESGIATGDVPIGADKEIASSGRLSFKAVTILDRSDAGAEFSAARAVNAVVANAFRGSPGPGEEKSRIADAAAWKSATQTRSSKAICILIRCGIQIFMGHSLSW